MRSARSKTPEAVEAAQRLLQDPSAAATVSESETGWEELYLNQRRALHSTLGRAFNTSYNPYNRRPDQKPIILLDVEGTTTPLPFVTRILYPESVRKFESFVSENYDTLLNNEIAAASKRVERLKVLLGENSSKKRKADIVKVFVQHLCELVEKNEKAPYLKAIQGRIWRVGYESGEIKGHLFDDVAKAIQRWSRTGLADVHIYSSGSIQAQKLLFRHSSHGDLTPFIKGYHDTISAGPKFESDSYVKIRKAVGVDRPIIFLTDILAEVTAAATAGVIPLLSVRPLNKKISGEDIQRAEDVVKRAPFPPALTTLSAGSETKQQQTELLTFCSFAQIPGAVEEESAGAWQGLQEATIPYRTAANRQTQNGQGLKSFL